jgi:hypothetical protein
MAYPTKSLSRSVLRSVLTIEHDRDKLAEASLLHEGRMARSHGRAVGRASVVSDQASKKPLPKLGGALIAFKCFAACA